MIGAVTMRLAPMRTSICTCCTSFVERVMSDGAPNSATSRELKRWTAPKTRARMSRPAFIAMRAENQAAQIAAHTWTTLTSSIQPPVRQM